MSKNITVTGNNFNEVSTKLNEIMKDKNIKIIHKQNYNLDNGQVGTLLVYNEKENIEGGNN